MRLSLASTIVALTVFTGDAFAPSSTSSRLSRTTSVLSSSVATRQAPAEIEEPADDDKKKVVGGIVPLTGEEINARRDAQFQKLRMKDKTSIQLEKQVCIDLYERQVSCHVCGCINSFSDIGYFARNFEESDFLILCFIVFFRN
jgi:hypothetical protein